MRAGIFEDVLLKSSDRTLPASEMFSLLYKCSEVISLALGYKVTAGAVSYSHHRRSLRPSVQRQGSGIRGLAAPEQNHIWWNQGPGACLPEFPPWEARLHDVRTESAMNARLWCPPQEKNGSEEGKQERDHGTTDSTHTGGLSALGEFSTLRIQDR